jgi:tetratricopeptide (TPR) repeat protein
MRGRFSLLIAGLLACSALAASVGEVAYKDYYRMRNRSALSAYQEGLKYAIRLADHKKEVIYLNNIAAVYFMAGISDSCRRYMDEARNSAGGSKMLRLITDINSALFNGQPMDIGEEQIEEFQDSLTAFELSALYTAAGRLCLHSNPDKALKLFKRAGSILHKETKSAGYASALFYSACAHYQKGSMADAGSTAEKAAKLFRKGEYILGVKKCLKLQLEIFQKTGNKSGEEETRRQLSRMP